jgi:hypothetical protein
MGVLQDDPLSPTLFGVYVDCVIQHLRSECPGVVVPTVQGRQVHGLPYADDLVLLSLDAQSAQHQLDALASFSTDFGLSVNLGGEAHLAFPCPCRRWRGINIVYKGQGLAWSSTGTLV